MLNNVLRELIERLQQHQERDVLRFKTTDVDHIIFERKHYMHPPSL